MDEDVAKQLHRDPDLFVRLAENASLVAEELRSEYLQSTIGVARGMRERFRSMEGPYRLEPVPADLYSPCTAAFIDGGLSRVDLGIDVPLIARAGIFRVKQGERDLEKRETFDHFPLLLGQLKGGLKANSRIGDVVRQLVELGAVITALEDDRFDDIRLLMLHGPLQFVSGPFFDHWFFPEDYEQMLGMGEGRPHVDRVLGKFTAWCKACPLSGSTRCTTDITTKHLPAVCMMAFLQEYAFKRSAEKGVLLCGAIERSFGRSITKQVIRQILTEEPEMFDRMLDALDMRGSTVGQQTEAILDATRYNDAVLLALAMQAGECLRWHPIDPAKRINDDRAVLFPHVQTTFVRSAAARYPMRLEAPATTSVEDLAEIVGRAHEYAALLPNYAFPIGLDVVDKFAAVPGWMTKAYKQLILAQWGRLISGDVVDLDDIERLQARMLTDDAGRRRRTERPGV